MLQVPTPDEVDHVAHYCNVAARLQHEVFLGEDSHDVLCQHSTGISVQLEHPALFNSVLSLFRRLWMKAEPSYYERVRNILYRYQPSGRYDGLRPWLFDYYTRLRKNALYPDLIT